MSVCGQNGQGEEDCAPEEMGASVRDLYKQKPASKVVRVLTVLAYLLSVSLAAILLSVYYVCVWKSPELPHVNNTELAALRQPPNILAENLMVVNSTGGSDSTVIPAIQPTSNTTDEGNNSTANIDLETDSTENIIGLSYTGPMNDTSNDIGNFNETASVT